MTKKTFLTEIGTEELPARLLYKIAHAFYTNFVLELKTHNISYEKIQWFATPRRLALQIINIDMLEKIIIIQKKGPSLSESFDANGNPTKKAIYWARDCNINLKDANRIKNKKGEWLTCKIQKKQESIISILPKIVEISLKKITLINKMRWKHNHKFFRPIRNIVLLLDNLVLPGKIFGVIANDVLYNHISFKEKKIHIQHAQQYTTVLWNEYNIIPNYEQRKDIIQRAINQTARQVNGFVKINPILIEEVNSIVESPHIFITSFQKKFLSIPEEILIYTLEHHQKCFSIHDHNNQILPYFIFVSNTKSKTSKEIILGHQKVIHARLSDTAFFLKNDKKNRLDHYLPLLKTILFHKKMGTMYDKTMRLIKLIEWISGHASINRKNAIRAATLSKCDLISNMVCEYPVLQGTIGMYYSLEEGEKKEISLALKEQYLPNFSGDKLPSSLIGSALSIADKIDTLSGMFIIENIPTADKDPFALRRLAIGILRIVIDKKIDIDIKHLIDISIKLYDKKIDNKKKCNQIIEFCMIRLSYWYEKKGYEINIIKSILSCQPTTLLNINNRIDAMNDFKKLKNSSNVILAIKRISHILEKNKEEICNQINVQLLIEKPEEELFQKTTYCAHMVKNILANNQYKKVLFELSQLEHPIQNFFNKIQIYHANKDIRINRLTLLYLIKKLFFKVANFTFLY